MHLPRQEAESLYRMAERSGGSFAEMRELIAVPKGVEQALREYARQVPRMFPRIRRRSSGTAGGGFSFDLYVKHREYNALLGTAAMAAALVVKMMLVGN